MLNILGVIFYIGAAFCGLVGVVSFGSENPFLPALLMAGAISNLFFGGMCFAVSRVVELLAVIADNTAPESEATEPDEQETGHDSSGADDQHCAWCDRTINSPHRPCTGLSRVELKMKDPGRYNHFCRTEIERRGGLTEAARLLDQSG